MSAPGNMSAATASSPTSACETVPPNDADDEDLYDDVDDSKSVVDPRIKIELETLNQSATDINCLEKEIDEARGKYQVTFSECSQQLEVLKKKFGGSIKKARPYYDLKEAAREAQSEALRSARKFQTANGVYLAAKETISLAELRLMDDRAASLSAAWQEMLNHALLRVMEAEKEKSVSEQEHLEKAAVFAEMENKLHLLEKKNKRSITKARSYFEAKKELEVKLQQVKQSVEDLQNAMKEAKRRYSCALKHLENISDGIHEKRRQKLILMFPREPGVGAEDNEDVSETAHTLPTLETNCDEDDHDFDDDDTYYDDTDEEDDGYADIDNESVFRAKVLTTSLDDEDTSFIKHKHSVRKRGRKPLKRTQSLPVYPTPRTLKEKEGISQEGSVDEIFGKPLVPLSDRSDNYPPDGDSLSSEKNIACNLESPTKITDETNSWSGETKMPASNECLNENVQSNEPEKACNSDLTKVSSDAESPCTQQQSSVQTEVSTTNEQSSDMPCSNMRNTDTTDSETQMSNNSDNVIHDTAQSQPSQEADISMLTADTGCTESADDSGINLSCTSECLKVECPQTESSEDQHGSEPVDVEAVSSNFKPDIQIENITIAIESSTSSPNTEHEHVNVHAENVPE